MLCRSFTYHVQFRKYWRTKLSPSFWLTLYYKHNAPTLCFGHSCGHRQGGALQEMDISRYLTSPPWEWPRKWPKHIGALLWLQHTSVHLCAFSGFTRLFSQLMRMLVILLQRTVWWIGFVPYSVITYWDRPNGQNSKTGSACRAEICRVSTCC